MFSFQDGEIAVRMARAEIQSHLGDSDVVKPEPTSIFYKRSGVFVTLNTHPDRELRGCIGFPEPVMELYDGVREAARSAATRDPRFSPVRLQELENIVIDVTLLTPPEDILAETPDELVRMVKVGRDGLIARMGPFSGLLLPQVPVEYEWSVEEFLSHTCLKAGLPPESWRRGEVKFKKFSGKVFGESTPGGVIEEMELE